MGEAGSGVGGKVFSLAQEPILFAFSDISKTPLPIMAKAMKKAAAPAPAMKKAMRRAMKAMKK